MKVIDIKGDKFKYKVEGVYMTVLNLSVISKYKQAKHYLHMI